MDFIVHAAAWLARLLIPATGRHRAGDHQTRHSAARHAAPPVHRARAYPRHTEPWHDTVALVRPYVLAALPADGTETLR